MRTFETGLPKELEAIKNPLKYTPDVNLLRSHHSVWIIEGYFDMIEVVIYKIDNFSSFVEIARKICVDEICCPDNVVCTLMV